MATAAKFDADFSDFLGELNKVEIKLAEFGPKVSKVSDQTRRLADSLNGNKIAEEATKAARAIQLIEGGVSALTKGEARKMGAIFDEFAEKSAAMGRKVPADMQAIKASLDAVRASADAMGKAGGSGPSFGDLFKEGVGLGAGMTAASAAANVALGAITAVKEQLTLAWQEGQKLSALGTAFENLQGGAKPATALLNDMRDATRGLVSDLDLMQAANKASLLGLNDMGIATDKMASIAVKLGKAMGQDAAKSVDDLTTALARQSPMILDNLGIKVSLADANKVYADSIGKAESALTDEERKLAFANAAMEAAEAKVKTLGEQQLTLGERIGAMQITAENARAEFGRWVNENPALIEVATKAAKAFDDVADGASAIYRELKSITDSIGGASSLWDGFVKTLDASLTPLRLVSLQLRTYAQMLKTAADALAYLRGEKFDPQDLPMPPVPEGTSFSRKPGDLRVGHSSSDVGDARVAGALTAEDKRRADQIAERERLANALEEELRKKAEQKRQQARERAQAKALADDKKYQKEKQDMTGATALAEAAVLQKQIDEISKSGQRLTDAAAVSTWNKLWDAKKIAATSAPELTKGIEASLRSLSTNPGVVAEAKKFSAKLVTNLFDPSELKKGAIKGVTNINENFAAAMRQSIGTQGLKLGMFEGQLTTQNVLADTYALKRGLEGVGVPMTVINERFETFIDDTDKWKTKIDSAAGAFSNLAEITRGIGGELDAVTGGIGSVLGAAESGAAFVKQLGGLFENENFGKSKAGQAIGGGLAGFSSGASLAAMTGTTSGWKGALAGAGGGAAAGALVGGQFGGWMGAGVGAGVGAIAGAIGGWVTARKNAKEARALMEQNRKDLLLMYETRENLIKQAGRLGISENEINRNILNNAKDVKAYQATIGKLTEATEREKIAAKNLSEMLTKVADARGVLNRQQAISLSKALQEGEGPRTEAAKAFISSQVESLMAGLEGITSGPMTAQLTQAVGNALPAAFAELKREGLSSLEALRAMQPVLDGFQKNAVAAGLGSTEGFDHLNRALGVLKDEKLGPLVAQADFAGQSLAALQNLGFGNQAAFTGFASSITDTFNAIKEGAGAEQALALLQQPLQNVWALANDFGYQVDEGTAALLEQAEAAGLVGDKMRPAADRAAAALDTVVERLDELIAVFKGDLVEGSEEGANEAGQRIVDTFAKYRPVVTVQYEYDMPTPPDVPVNSATGDQAARAATQGAGEDGGIYMDGERVGYVVGRHLGKVSDYAGA